MMVLYSPDWINTGFSFILLTVNLFRHSTLTEQGLYPLFVWSNNFTYDNSFILHPQCQALASLFLNMPR